MKEKLQARLQAIVQELYGSQETAELSRTDEKFGDYATNIALKLAKTLGQNPREVAQAITDKLQSSDDAMIAKTEIAGPGFINITLSDQALNGAITVAAAKPDTLGKTTSQQGKVTIVEYSDPNPFKVLHVGHLYDSVFGEAVASLCAAAGATVHRVNFGGDVGLHVGRTMWAILQRLGGENPQKLAEIPASERSDWMASAYVEGTQAYEDSEASKAEIIAINQKVYDVQAQQDHDSPFAQIYWTCRQWSYDYFEVFYERIGTKFEKYYPESITAPAGIQAVKEQLTKGVFKESDGAVVFDGEKYGLHTRVFLSSKGLPTYEAKDIGLAINKWQDYQFDRNIIISGNDIIEYMKVVLKALEQFEPQLAERTQHITHGMVKLAGGVKMSSRKGNFLRAADILDIAAEANKEQNQREDEAITLGAVKYAFLKQRIGSDIIYDPKESVSLQGNSGPYLQYAHARARSILAKAPAPAEGSLALNSTPADSLQLEPGERSLARKITEFQEVTELAIAELMPHHVCTYLYELAQTFNRFYEGNRVIGSAEREGLRLQLVLAYANILRAGLQLLNIAALEHM